LDLLVDCAFSARTLLQFCVTPLASIVLQQSDRLVRRRARGLTMSDAGARPIV
jgi:hypothetical protein